MAKKLTLDDLRKMDCDMLTPAQVAPVLGVDPHWIRVAAREHPEWIGFPVLIVRSRTKIPRLGFISWMEGRAA